MTPEVSQLGAVQDNMTKETKQALAEARYLAAWALAILGTK